MKLVIAVAFAALLHACATVDYGSLRPGIFRGSLIVMWIDEGGSTGDGTFLYLPDPKDPLMFKRADGQRPGAIIQPGMMYTDGGSIPKIAQIFNGFSPWGYAPAYMIHDWMFVARHCLVDGISHPLFNQVRDVRFDDSAAILGEAIRTLIATRRVKPNDLAGSTITTTVNSVIARNIWDETGGCAKSRISAKDLAAAEQAVPGSSRFAVPLDGTRTRTRADVLPGGKPARVVARVTF